MLIFGVRVVMFFRYAKWSVKMPFTRFSLSCTRTMCPGSFSTVVSFWNGSAADTVCDESTQLIPVPDSASRKSWNHERRRNSPSVTTWRPTLSCSRTTSTMASSSRVFSPE